MRVLFHGLRFDLPQGWADITGELPENSPPTLARNAGVGVIQFSIAKYRSGNNPDVKIADLQRLMANFCASRSLKAREMEVIDNRIMIVGYVAISEINLIAAWYLSNGRDLALITYTSIDADHADTGAELATARTLIATICF